MLLFIIKIIVTIAVSAFSSFMLSTNIYTFDGKDLTYNTLCYCIVNELMVALFCSDTYWASVIIGLMCVSNFHFTSEDMARYANPDVWICLLHAAILAGSLIIDQSAILLSHILFLVFLRLALNIVEFILRKIGSKKLSLSLSNTGGLVLVAIYIAQRFVAL